MASSIELVAFEKKFRQQDLHIADVGSWKLSLRPGQVTLGSMVLASRSGATAMADLSAADIQVMGEGFQLAERLAKGVFGAKRVNYLCLMMQDPLLHFHILPRYDSMQEFMGICWTDDAWPSAPQLVTTSVDESVLIQMRNALREGI